MMDSGAAVNTIYADFVAGEDWAGERAVNFARLRMDLRAVLHLKNSFARYGL